MPEKDEKHLCIDEQEKNYCGLLIGNHIHEN